MRIRRICSLLYNKLETNVANTTLNATTLYTQRGLSKSASLGSKSVFGGPTKYIHHLEFLSPKIEDAIPTYQVLNPDGTVINPHEVPELSDEILMRMYMTMVQQHEMDTILYSAQRQGRIAFYMTNHGEEAAQVGSAAGLSGADLVFGQYREAGVLAWRGFRLKQFMDHCYGNKNDPSLGRNLPLHYGSKELNFVTISSTLATQMPQAAGAAYALKRSNPGTCVICYFGEGAASEGDAHAAFNIAATLDAPCIFFCRNNGYAISTRTDEQYRGDGIAARGAGYGMLTIRVDGNDIFAVYNATRKARQIAITENRPVLIEAMTYRIGHHSTSDDSSTYRTPEEVALWRSYYDPIERMKRYLIDTKYLWSERENEGLISILTQEIFTEFGKAEKRLKASPSCLLTDVYDDLTDHLKRQHTQLKNHVMKYKEHYPLDRHEPFNN